MVSRFVPESGDLIWIDLDPEGKNNLPFGES